MSSHGTRNWVAVANAARELLAHWDDCTPPADLASYLAGPIELLRRELGGHVTRSATVTVTGDRESVAAASEVIDGLLTPPHPDRPARWVIYDGTLLWVDDTGRVWSLDHGDLNAAPDATVREALEALRVLVAAGTLVAGGDAA